MIPEPHELPIQRDDLPDPTITTGWSDRECWLFLLVVAAVFGGGFITLLLAARP